MAKVTAPAPTAIALMGPTATGKTALAIALAEAFPVDVISVDSALVYRGMDIGTAKPDADELARAPHRLIDVCDPADTYSAGRFRRDALAEIRRSDAAGRVPLLVGGTMLYFRALFEGIDDLPRADTALRRSIDARAQALGWPALHAELAGVDPPAAARIHPNDAQRIQRALEVHAQSGVPLSALQTREPAAPFTHRLLKLALIPEDRAVLHARIEARFARILAAGFVDEVKALYSRDDLSAASSAMRAVGYRQLWRHLAGEISLAEAERQAITATRRLAKRQLTWLRRETDLKRLDPQAPDLIGQAKGLVADFFRHDSGLPID